MLEWFEMFGAVCGVFAAVAVVFFILTWDDSDAQSQGEEDRYSPWR